MAAGTSHTEVLMNISDDDIDALTNTYRTQTELKYATGILRIGRKLRERRNYLLRFIAPESNWREDGTFFIFMEFPHRYDLAVFSLEASGQKIYEGLMRTKRIHFDRLLLFCAIPRSIYPTILKVIQEKNLKVESDIAHHIYTISKTEALEFDTRCPNEVEVKRLRREPHAMALVNSSWPNKFPNFEEYLISIIEQNDCFGIYLPSGEIVSWVLQMEMGNIGIVYCVDSYQNKGYESLLVKRLAKEIAEEDEDPTVFIKTSDQATQVFFEKLCFKNVGLCNNIELVTNR